MLLILYRIREKSSILRSLPNIPEFYFYAHFFIPKWCHSSIFDIQSIRLAHILKNTGANGFFHIDEILLSFDWILYLLTEPKFPLICVTEVLLAITNTQDNTNIAILIFHLLVVVVVTFNALVVNELFSVWHVLWLANEVSFTGLCFAQLFPSWWHYIGRL